MNTRFTGKLFLLFILLATHLQAQDSLFARRVLDTLTSPTLDGRGYLKDGANKAAHYISDRFTQFHLQSFGANYYQPFTMDVNVFPGQLSVKLNDQQLKNGKDFLVAPYSSGCSGDYPVNYPDWLALYQSFTKRRMKFSPSTFNVIDKNALPKEVYSILMKTLKENNNFGAKGLIELTTEKLTWDIAQEARPYTHLIVRKDSLPKKELKTISIQLENKFIPNYPTQNVIGFIKGKVKPDSFIVLTAHYDHLGQMGDGTYFPGANDNASGISMLLSLASYYSRPANQPKYTIVFIAFSGEEPGLLGSKYYTEHPLFPLSAIRFLVNMDIVGTGEEGITVVNGSVFQSQFDRLAKLNNDGHYLKTVKVRGKASNSDHYFFSEKGVPAFFIYTMGGISAYHDVFDRDETLPLNKFNSLELLLKSFVASF